MAHWTTESSDAFVRRVTFDFWTQLQKRFDALPLTQLELAQMFKVSESAVSQTLNNSRNPTLKTLFHYAQAAKLKFSIVPYEDSDPEHGPINSEIFTICWEKAGRPRTFGQASALRSVESALTSDSLIVPVRKRLEKMTFPSVFFHTHTASFVEPSASQSYIQSIQGNIPSVARISLTSPLEIVVTELESGYSAMRPIPIKIRKSDDSYIASFEEANIHASGETWSGAALNLKSLILDIYDSLISEAARLGPGPKRQLATLLRYVETQ